MKKNLFFVFGTLFVVCLFLNEITNRSVTPIPVTFSARGFPVVEVEIEKQKYPLQFSLFSKYSLFLDQDVLGHIKKTCKGNGEWRNEKGDQFHAPLFHIPKLKIRNFTIRNAITVSNIEKSNDSNIKGILAWEFKKGNLLLDFPHGKIWSIKNREDVNLAGFDLKKMKKVPCKIDERGVHVSVETSLGSLNMILGTYSNKNIIKESLSEKSSSISSKIKIGNQEYEEPNFFFYPIKDEWGIDGVLGTDFLKAHAVFIDWKNEFIYIGGKQGNALSKFSLEKIPVEFTRSGVPVIFTKIGKNIYRAKIDLGSSFELTLLTQNLPEKDLSYLKSIQSIDAIGRETNTDVYSFPECQIGKSVLNNVFINNETNQPIGLNIHSEDQGTLNPREYGKLGYPILHRTNLFFDFENNGVWFVNQEKDLKKIGVYLQEYEKIPFKLLKGGMVIEAKTQLSLLNLLIDTGATFSFIKPSLLTQELLFKDEQKNFCFLSDFFVLGEVDYGKHYFHPFELTSKIGKIDGILGMDFLKKHSFYIDFQEGYIHFKKPSIAKSI